ncbi:hypothetical protein ES705_38443 [subsurface metagenome]
MIWVKIIFTWLIIMIFYAVYKMIFKKKKSIPEQIVIKARDGKTKIVILRNQ